MKLKSPIEGFYTLLALVYLSIFINIIEHSFTLVTLYQDKLNAIERIDQRIEIEKKIVDHFSENKSRLEMSMHNSNIIAVYHEEKIFVNIIGDINLAFEYDIIRDGSFIINDTEDLL